MSTSCIFASIYTPEVSAWVSTTSSKCFTSTLHTADIAVLNITYAFSASGVNLKESVGTIAVSTNSSLTNKYLGIVPISVTVYFSAAGGLCWKGVVCNDSGFFRRFKIVCTLRSLVAIFLPKVVSDYITLTKGSVAPCMKF